jgi:hypothetical protein
VAFPLFGQKQAYIEALAKALQIDTERAKMIEVKNNF